MGTTRSRALTTRPARGCLKSVRVSPGWPLVSFAHYFPQTPPSVHLSSTQALPIVIRGNSSRIVNLISSSLFRCFWSFEGRKCHQVSPQSLPPPITMSFPKYRCIASRTRREATTLELLPIPFTNSTFTSLKRFLVVHPHGMR